MSVFGRPDKIITWAPPRNPAQNATTHLEVEQGQSAHRETPRDASQGGAMQLGPGTAGIYKDEAKTRPWVAVDVTPHGAVPRGNFFERIHTEVLQFVDTPVDLVGSRKSDTYHSDRERPDTSGGVEATHDLLVLVHSKVPEGSSELLAPQDDLADYDRYEYTVTDGSSAIAKVYRLGPLPVAVGDRYFEYWAFVDDRRPYSEGHLDTGDPVHYVFEQASSSSFRTPWEWLYDLRRNESVEAFTFALGTVR